MLLEASDKFQVAKRAHQEMLKGQHVNEDGTQREKNYFRASEMGNGDRKILYSFFKHQIPHDEPTAHGLRIFENGDYVHDRYQKQWADMGALISMEQRLSSKDDEYLAQFPWEWAGHYDGELDINILRAHALDLVSVESVYNEDTEEWEISVILDEAYANSIGIFDAEGNLAEDYYPPVLLADIKTMNPWGFDRLIKNADVSDIQGYIDQIQFYMYMKNTPYGSIFIENKANNNTLEVQVLWRDIHEDVLYEFEEEIHGQPAHNKIRVVIDSERFFGGDHMEGAVPRVTRLWELAESIKKADTEGDFEMVAKLMPARCSDEPDSFPCSWKSGRCDFYEHCWGKNEGLSVRPVQAIPPEAIWEFDDTDTGDVIRVDNRKVPEGVTYEGFIGLISMGVLNLDQFVIKEESTAIKTTSEAESTAVNADNLFDASGELLLTEPMTTSQGDDEITHQAPAVEAHEYKLEDGSNAIDCVNCGKQVSYMRLANGGTKKCPRCKHTNRVIKLS